MHPNLVTCHERIAQCDLHHRTTVQDGFLLPTAFRYAHLNNESPLLLM